MGYPYANSIPGFLSVIKQLRSVFPRVVTADTLKKWGQAPNNETYVISTLIFLGIINDDGTKNEAVADVLLLHDEEFKVAFQDIVKASYAELFEVFGEQAWSLDKAKLVGFFRQADKSSEPVGKRQASTFQAIAGLCGFGDLPKEKAQITPKPKPPKLAPENKSISKVTLPSGQNTLTETVPEVDKNSDKMTTLKRDASLTVRIEINLPVTDDQSVYDKIFKSIKENLLTDK